MNSVYLLAAGWCFLGVIIGASVALRYSRWIDKLFQVQGDD